MFIINMRVWDIYYIRIIIIILSIKMLNKTFAILCLLG